MNNQVLFPHFVLIAIVVPDVDEMGVRRSTRCRMQPISWWETEKVVRKGDNFGKSPLLVHSQKLSVLFRMKQ